MYNNYKWSVFVLDTIDIAKDNVVVYNTLNKALAIFEKDFYSLIKGLSGKQLFDYCIKNNYEYVFNQLVEEEFIILSEINEQENYIKSLKSQIINHDSITVHFLPTMGCNFRCPYCYQGGVSRTDKMSKKDVDCIIDSLDLFLSSHNYLKNMTITLHGGEPTCNWDIVPYAMEEFDRLANKYELKLFTSIVSNGYLLDSAKAELLYKYNWYRFQVTIDGPREVHNLRRCLFNGEDTFSCIVNNMKYILDNNLLKSIDLRINFDNSNYDYIPDLLDFLADVFQKERISLSFGVVSQTVSGNESFDYIKSNKISDNNFIDRYLSLYKLATEKGFSLDEAYVFGSLCMAKINNSFAFSPDGYVYKCLSLVGRDLGREGYWKNQIDLSKITSLIDYDIIQECFTKKCPMIPLCNGDCRFDSLIKNGDYKHVYCRKDKLLKINKEILNIKYADYVNL